MVQCVILLRMHLVSSGHMDEVVCHYHRNSNTYLIPLTPALEAHLLHYEKRKYTSVPGFLVGVYPATFLVTFQSCSALCLLTNSALLSTHRIFPNTAVVPPP